MNKTLIYLLLLLISVSFLQADVNVVVDGRCIFGSIIMGLDECQKDTGIKVNINEDCAGLDKGINAVIKETADIGTIQRDLC